MTKTLLAAAAMLLLATTAQAKIFCTVLHAKDLKQVEYTFVPFDQGNYAETSVSREGATLTHRPGARPLWSYRDLGNHVASASLTYNVDPRYRLIVRDDGEQIGPGMTIANVVLMREQDLIAIGACVITPQPRAHGGF